MRRLAFAAVSIAMIAGFGFWWLHNQPAGEPGQPGMLIADPAELIVSRQEAGSQPTVTVSLRNAGARPVRILQITTSCGGCTVAEPLKTSEVPPGDAMPLTLKANVPDFGRRSVVVQVTTDRDTPDLRIPLTLIGEELPPPHIRSRPPQVELSGYVPGAEVSREVIVFTVEQVGTQAWLTGLNTSGSLVQAELIGDPHAQSLTEDTVLRSYRFMVTTRLPDWTTGRVRLLLSLESLTPATRAVPPIVVEIHCLKPIQVVPETVFVSADELSRPPVGRSLLLRACEDREWTVTGIDSSHPCLSASIESQPAGSHLGRIRIKVTSPESPAEEATEKAVLSIHTTHPLRPTIEVPVFLQTSFADVLPTD